MKKSRLIVLIGSLHKLTVIAATCSNFVRYNKYEIRNIYRINLTNPNAVRLAGMDKITFKNETGAFISGLYYGCEGCD